MSSVAEEVEAFVMKSIEAFTSFFVEILMFFIGIFELASSGFNLAISPPFVSVTSCINKSGVKGVFTFCAVSRNAANGSTIGHIFQADSVIGINPTFVLDNRRNINLIRPLLSSPSQSVSSRYVTQVPAIAGPARPLIRARANAVVRSRVFLMLISVSVGIVRSGHLKTRQYSRRVDSLDSSGSPSREIASSNGMESERACAQLNLACVSLL